MTTSLDDRIRAATDDLQARAALHALPEVEAARRPSRLPLALVGAVAASLLVVIGVGVIGGDEPATVVDVPTTVITPPEGVVPVTFESPGMGARVDVPDGWTWSPSIEAEHLLAAPGGESHVSFIRQAALDDVGIETFAGMRRAFLAGQPQRADHELLRIGEVDGHDVAFGTYELEGGQGPFRAYDAVVDLGDGTFTTVTVLDVDPELAEWILSTIEVEPDAGDTDVLLDAMYEVVQHDHGFAFEIVDGWGEVTEADRTVFQVIIGGWRGWVLANRLPVADLATWEQRLTELGARDVEVEETTKGGRPARLLHYRFPEAQDGFAGIDTEIQVDVGDGTIVQVVVGHGGALPQEVVDRIVQSVRITE
ncbi:MAG TPA: hypothetical protein VEA78_00680 [Acidimicrobiales bacterium]|nr:hypothetical protein [Acidimicrobiales bacterium]